MWGFADKGDLGLGWSPSVPNAQAIALSIENALGLGQLLRRLDAEETRHVQWVNGLACDIVLCRVAEVDADVGDDLADIDKLIGLGAFEDGWCDGLVLASVAWFGTAG